MRGGGRTRKRRPEAYALLTGNNCLYTHYLLTAIVQRFLCFAKLYRVLAVLTALKYMAQ